MRTRARAVLLVVALAACAEGERVVGDTPSTTERTPGTVSIAELRGDLEAWRGREVVLAGMVKAGLAFESALKDAHFSRPRPPARARTQ